MIWAQPHRDGRQYNLNRQSYNSHLHRRISDCTGRGQPMIVVRRPPAMRPFAMLLALAMLVFATMADAATCGSEAFADGNGSVAASSYDVNVEQSGDQGDPDAPVEQHGVCAHGHCHHGSNIEDGPAEAASLLASRAPLSGDVAGLSPVEREIVSPPPRS